MKGNKQNIAQRTGIWDDVSVLIYWFQTQYLIHRNKSCGNSQFHKRGSSLSHHQDDIVFLTFCQTILSSSISQLCVCLSLAIAVLRSDILLPKIFQILTGKMFRKEINFLMTSIKLIHLSLCAPLATSSYWLKYKKKWFVSLSEFVVNKTVTEFRKPE